MQFSALEMDQFYVHFSRLEWNSRYEEGCFCELFVTRYKMFSF